MMDMKVCYVSLELIMPPCSGSIWRRNGFTAFFAPSEMWRVALSNAQLLTLEGLEGRIVSSSYMPQPEPPSHPSPSAQDGAPPYVGYAAMRAAIADLFEKFQENGRVRLEYECAIYYGQLG